MRLILQEVKKKCKFLLLFSLQWSDGHANCKQLSALFVCKVCNVVDKHYKIREEFLHFQYIDQTNGGVPLLLILGKLEQRCLKSSDCRRQGNGTSNIKMLEDFCPVYCGFGEYLGLVTSYCMQG